MSATLPFLSTGGIGESSKIHREDAKVAKNGEKMDLFKIRMIRGQLSFLPEN
ncbi:MAG: hypothetical protein KF712_17620 [Akkermansiaceae bacterium]|nr:hypothetical protein [Akkermansiaceae bacterium]